MHELKKAQQELQRQVIANQKRRQKLLPLVEEAMISQREERREIERLSRLEEDCLRELVILIHFNLTHRYNLYTINCALEKQEATCQCGTQGTYKKIKEDL